MTLSSFVIAHARVVCRMRFVFNHMYFHRMVSASDGGLLGQMILPAIRPPLKPFQLQSAVYSSK